MNRGRRSHRSRGVALAAVLVVGLGLLLVAAGTIHVVRAEVAAIGGTESRVQSRLAARSATRAVASMLAEERGRLLAGGLVDLPESFEVLELAGGTGGRLAIARLLPIGLDGGLLVPEASKLDLNTIDAESLVRTGLVDRLEADTIIAARNARPGGRFSSVLDLLSLEGDGAVEVEGVVGPLAEVRVLSRIDGDDEDLGERILDRLATDLPGEAALVDVLTVHAFEPDVDRAGLAREPWSGEGPLGTGLVGRSKSDGLAIEDIGRLYDETTAHEGGWRNGLLDINTATLSALKGIEGMDADLAAAIVSRRDDVPEDLRFDRFWPVTEGLVELETWAGIVDRITTRSTVWRAMVGVGIVPAEDPDAPMESPVVWEIVVDVGDPRPRMVEIRDVTMLELVARFEASRIRDEGLSPGDRRDGFPMEAEDSRFPEDTLFTDDPLFIDDPLFPADDLFPDRSLFDDASMFEDRPLFTDEPGFSEEASTTGENADSGDAVVRPRDRGPGGRWRPATSSR